MRKKKVLFVAVLKPVNDTRMYEKFARTLAEADSFEVHVVGFRPPKPVAPVANV